MHEIGMNKTTSKKPVPLVLLCDSRWIKDQIVNDFMVTEAVQGNKYRNDDNG
jgi:hypothetical protein